MKEIRIYSVIFLIIAVFVTISLGVNAFYSLLPEINDGISSRSIFIHLDNGWTRERFFNVFETSLRITFALFVENAIVWLLPKNIKI